MSEAFHHMKFWRFESSKKCVCNEGVFTVVAFSVQCDKQFIIFQFLKVYTIYLHGRTIIVNGVSMSTMSLQHWYWHRNSSAQTEWRHCSLFPITFTCQAWVNIPIPVAVLYLMTGELALPLSVVQVTWNAKAKVKRDRRDDERGDTSKTEKSLARLWAKSDPARGYSRTIIVILLSEVRGMCSELWKPL